MSQRGGSRRSMPIEWAKILSDTVRRIKQSKAADVSKVHEEIDKSRGIELLSAFLQKTHHGESSKKNPITFH